MSVQKKSTSVQAHKRDQNWHYVYASSKVDNWASWKKEIYSQNFCLCVGGDEMKLKRATYRHIEAEIHAYYDTLKAIEELRRDIILAGRQENSYAAVVGDRYAGTSIVERRATKLADSILLREMERITKAIADTYSQAKEQCRQVLWVKYGLALEDWHPPEEIRVRMEGRNRFDMGPDQMAEVLNVDPATFHRYRSGFIYGIAERLGWY